MEVGISQQTDPNMQEEKTVERERNERQEVTITDATGHLNMQSCVQL